MYGPRLNILIGAFGSGKTEVAVNYALKLKRRGERVGLVDLDIVNPFFRSRELKAFLQSKGVELVSSQDGLEAADLPALSPRIFAFLQNTAYQVIFDVGGDPVGARALGRFEKYFSGEPYNLWLVINPYRPGCSTPEELYGLARRLEETSKLKINGIVDNTNLGKETTAEIRTEGARIVDDAARLLAVPVVMRTVVPPQTLQATTGEAILSLELFMTTPWETSPAGEVPKDSASPNGERPPDGGGLKE